MENYEEQLARLEDKIDAVYVSAEKSRKYMLTTIIITVVTIVLPILVAIFALPALIGSLGSAYQI